MARVSITSGYYNGTDTTDLYGSGSTGQFVPALWSKKVLRNFYENTFYNDICNTDYEGEIKGQGDKVVIRATPELTVSDYAIGGTISYETPTSTALELVIDKAKAVAFRVDDIDRAQSDLGLVNMFAEDAAYRTKIAVDTDVLGYMATGPAAANKGATAGAITSSIDLGSAATVAGGIAITTTNAIDKIVEINQVLDEANQPSEGRFIVLPAWYCALLKLGDLRRADVTGDGTGVIRNGQVGMVDRTMIYQSNLLTHATDTSTEVFSIVAGTKEGTTFAAQITKTDTLKIPDSFGEYWRNLFVYGRKNVQADALSLMYAYKG